MSRRSPGRAWKAAVSRAACAVARGNASGAVRPEEAVRWTLDNFLADITLQLWQLSDSLTQTYFTHTGPSRQLGAVAQNEE